MAVRISFRTKLLASHAAVAVAVGAVTLLLVERAVSSQMEAQIDRRLEAQAIAVAGWLQRAGHPDRLAGRLAGVVGARVTFIDKDGVSVGESRQDVDVETPLSPDDLPAEVGTARGGEIGHATRFSESDRERVRYVAVPAAEGAVIRLGVPIGEIDETVAEIRRQLGVGALGSLAAAFALAAFVAVSLTRRLRAARQIAEQIAAGDYEVQDAHPSTDEVGILTRTLVDAAAQLEETEARRREFLANVAHEIRTPVTSIRGYAETLKDSETDADTRNEFLGTIHRNSVRIARLVEDLLELEAIQAGEGRSLDRDRVEIAHIAQAVVRTVEGRAEQELDIELDVPDDVTATADADAIERVLLNLIDNAVRHGGEKVQVRVRARRRGERTVVTVRDNGPGIPEQQRTRIFERFQRVDTAASRDATGSGLGLAISRDLAQAMAGSLALTHTDEPGASFTLELPG